MKPTSSTHPDPGVAKFIDNYVEGLLHRSSMYTGGSREVEESLWMVLIQLESLPLGDSDLWYRECLKARYDRHVNVPSPYGLAAHTDTPMSEVYHAALESVRAKVKQK